MTFSRRVIMLAGLLVFGWATLAGAVAAETRSTSETVLANWYGLALELVRHTPTYSPPVASRAFAYMGVAAFEAAVGGSERLTSLAGQLHGLSDVPQREPGAAYDEAVVINAVLATAVRGFFSNTGPTGQRAIKAAEKQWHELAGTNVPLEIAERSEAYGRQVAVAIMDWSQSDGGATVANMGFPLSYDLPKGDDQWVPTSLIAQQQYPLLPGWGKNRPFAMPEEAACPIGPPVAYSKDPKSAFYLEAMEVYETVRQLTPEQQATARFWSDDAMLSTTPPGHWISITLQIAKAKNLSLEASVDVLARLGVGMADAFIGCWRDKYAYNLVRPLTYIRALIDPAWDTVLITPPFPEYPSGHSTVSGAAATVLTGVFGDNFAFDDLTGERDGLVPRVYPSFWAAANEAGISRLYGGIHYRAAIERGLDQGRCIGANAVALQTWR